MVNKGDKERIRVLLSEAITVLCKNGLGFDSEFSVEGLLGITVDKEDIFLVNIKESVQKTPEEVEKNGHNGKSGSDHGYQTLSFASTLEGVTGEFIEVAHSGVNGNHGNNNKRSRGQSKGNNHASVKAQQTGSAVKLEQADSRLANAANTSVGAGQVSIQGGELMVGSPPWDQSLTAASVSQAVATPVVAAAMSQMSGIAQPTQLDDQRRRSRDHMRRYRQQLRSGNYSEYEDRKRRQREGMRRYRERLRVENPEKYADMNRKHAEQERRRRMRVRSFSASFAQQTAANQGLQGTMQAGGNGDTSPVVKLGTTDFLHMAMENSQLLPMRDVHQLIQTGYPLPGGGVGLTPPTLSLVHGTVNLPPGSVALTTGSGTVTALTTGSGTVTDGTTMTGLTPVPIAEIHQQQQQQHVQQQQQELPSSSQTQPILQVQEAHVMSSSSPVMSSVPVSVEAHCSQGQCSTVGEIPQSESVLQAQSSMANAVVVSTVSSTGH